MSKWEIPPRGGHMDLSTGVYFQNMTSKQIKDNEALDLLEKSYKNRLTLLNILKRCGDAHLGGALGAVVAERHGCVFRWVCPAVGSVQFNASFIFW